MKLSLTILLAGLLFFSCRKTQTGSPAFSEAHYTVTLNGQWAGPFLGVPAGAHFTTFVGMVHNANGFIWKEASPASPGMELLAEIGNGVSLLAEIDSMTRAGNSSALLLFTAPAATGEKITALYCNSHYPRISFASMLGNTPDWFTGINSLSLFGANGWVQDTLISLYVYDAGTEEGNSFSSNNPASSPHQPIRRLTAQEAPVLANGNPTLAPIATVRFTKQ